MYLSKILLETSHFEDYLSFLTDVLELEVKHVTNTSMLLRLKNAFLEIRKSTFEMMINQVEMDFFLTAEEFEDLNQRAKFFHYRKGQEKFSFSGPSEILCEFLDPDGRVWRFINLEYSDHYISSSQSNM